jgi:dihydropteroate synthase
VLHDHEAAAAAADPQSGVLRLGPRRFRPGEFAVMAIVNRTPDSFFDGGTNYATAAALDAIDRAVAAGADLVDVGGVKAGYGEPVSEAEELRRTVDFVARSAPGTAGC